MLRFLETGRPDYLVAFPAWYPDLTGAGGLFEEIHRQKIPDNITAGGSELVLYRTPWTRYPLASLASPASATSPGDPL